VGAASSAGHQASFEQSDPGVLGLRVESRPPLNFPWDGPDAFSGMAN